MEKQETYDERELRRIWGKGQPGRRFAVVKNYLQKLLLRSLRRQLEGNSPGMYFREQIDYIELLFDKGQGELCGRLIRRTKKKAAQLGESLVLLTLIRWEKRLARWNAGGKLPETMAALAEEELRHLEDVHAETTLQGIRDRMFGMIVQQLNPREPGVRRELEALLSHPLLGQPPDRLPPEAQLAYRFVYAYYFHMRGAFRRVTEQYREMIRLWDKHPEKKKWEEQRYINTLYLYLDSCYLAGDFDEFPVILPVIRRIRPREMRNRALRFHLLHHLQFRYFLNTGRFKEAVPLEGEIERGLRTYGTLLSPNIVLSFYYNLAILFFILEDFPRALRWLNRIVHAGDLPARKDLQGTSRILLLIFHFELENADLLDSLLPASSRYLARQSPGSGFEKAILKGLRTLYTTPAGERAAVWLRLREEVNAIREETGIPAPAEAEICAWLESRITGQPMATLLRDADAQQA